MDRLRLPNYTNTLRAATTFKDGEIVWVRDTKKLYVGDGTTAGGIEIAGGGGGGATTYLALTDTPGSFTAHAIQKANAGGTALENMALGSNGNVIYNNSGVPTFATPDTIGLVDKSSAQTSIAGNKAWTGTQAFQAASDAVEYFKVSDNAGTNVFNIDTTNQRVGVLEAAPAYALDVTGDIHSTTFLRVGGAYFNGSTLLFNNATGTILENGFGNSLVISGDVTLKVAKSASHINFQSGGANTRMRITADGDVLIGTTDAPSADNGKLLVFGDNTADPTLGTNTAGVYGKDVSGTVELFAVDEAGNATQLSSHDPETGEWRFYSKNTKTGRVLNVKMEKLVFALQKLLKENGDDTEYIEESESLAN